MKIAIVAAMEEEALMIINNINDKQKYTYNNFDFHIGKYLNNDIIVTVSGVGKVASAILSTTLIDHFKDIDLVISVGVGGGIEGKTEVGEVMIFDEYAYCDADATYFNYSYGQIPGCPKTYNGSISSIEKAINNIAYKKGMILTGDSFFTNKDEINSKIENYFNDKNVLSLDMESCAFAQSFWSLKVPFVTIKVVSDVIGVSSNDYEKNLDMCTKIAQNTLLTILKKM